MKSQKQTTWVTSDMRRQNSSAFFFFLPVVLRYYLHIALYRVPFGADGKQSACSARDLGSIPGVG